LCAILLLADKTGIALDSEAAHTRFPLLDRFLPPDRNHAAAAIKTRLFIADGENRFVPKHRSIAEYLAARWLARRLDRRQLSLHRLLGLFTGGTGGVV